MIHRPKANRHPDGFATYKKVSGIAENLPVTHLGTQEFKIDGDWFIPQKWDFRNYVLCPNITNQGALFRGEAIDLDREGNVPLKYSRNQQYSNIPSKRLYNRLRWFDIRRLLDSNPMYHMLMRGIWMDDNRDSVFKVSSSLFLHSYGLSSPFVSLTSDLYIALFYAVTDFDKETGKFIPTKKKYGILSYCELQTPITPVSRVIPVGLQVFERPGVNKEFVCRLKRDEDYYSLPYVKGFVFEQNEKTSYALLDQFNNGTLLLPSDDILADKIKISEGIFTKSSYDFMKRMFPQSELGLEYVKDKYNMVESLEDIGKYFRFNKEELEKYYHNIDYWWYEFCKKIYFNAAPELDERLLINLPYDSRYSRYFRQCRL